MAETIVKVKCANCNKTVLKRLAHVNRAKKNGNLLFCNQSCFGLYYRTSLEEKKAAKHAYDQKLYKQEWYPLYKAFLFHLDYAAHPEKYKQIRHERYNKHLQYLNTPKYKRYKQKYDKEYRAKLNYGEFWEAALITEKIELFLDKRMSRQDRDCHNKAQKRRKLCKNSQQ